MWCSSTIKIFHLWRGFIYELLFFWIVQEWWYMPLKLMVHDVHQIWLLSLLLLQRPTCPDFSVSVYCLKVFNFLVHFPFAPPLFLLSVFFVCFCLKNFFSMFAWEGSDDVWPIGSRTLPFLPSELHCLFLWASWQKLCWGAPGYL